MREYKLRVPREIPEATSENVAAWLSETQESKGALAADPGGGPVRISLSLDPAKVLEFANARRERVHVALRRLIASHVKLEPLPDTDEKPERPSAAEAKELLPERVLPRKLAYEAKDFVGFVRAMDKGLALTYRKIYRLDELKPAETADEDRELAGALAEVCNRRSPAWMLANADLVKLGITSFRWGMAQTEDLDGRVRETKPRNGKAPVITLEQPAEAAAPSPTSTPASAVPHPSTASAIAAEEMQHLESPVQQEGEF